MAGGRVGGARSLSPLTSATEAADSTPYRSSLRAGEPRAIDHRPSFVDGIGGRSVLEEMWPLARTLLAGSLAAALKGLSGARTVVCVVSGGNIDNARLVRILQ